MTSRNKTDPKVVLEKIGPFSHRKFEFIRGGSNVELSGFPHWPRVLEDLKSGKIQIDANFDEIFPLPLRHLSATHWTPLEVIRRATELLVVNTKTRVLDVGAGSGKFCLVGALLSDGHFTGVEQRYELAAIASEMAKIYSIPRVTFHYGRIETHDWSSYNAFYLFNPFYELLLGKESSTTGKNQELFQFYVQTVQQKLLDAPLGARVVTYHGFGGTFPEGYIRAERATAGSGELELWIRARR